MEEHKPSPVIRDLPWGPWILGLIVGSFGALVVQSTLRTGNTTVLFLAAILCGGGLLLVALSPVLTVRVEREGGLLTLTYRSLLAKRVKEIPLHKIDSIDVEGYGVVITQSDGRVTPLRSLKRAPVWRRRVAGRLRELAGVGGSDGGVLRTLTGRDESANRQIRRRQEALTGPNAERRQTDGVGWIIQSAGMGREPVTRWFSPDYMTNGTFVYIAQMPAYRNALGGMIGKLFTRGTIGRLAARASMALYGFVGESVPGSELADALALDPPLDRYFVAFSPDPSAARLVLNSSVAEALAGWAVRHPLKAVQAGNVPGQLVVLYSPDGVYAATRGLLDPSGIEELAGTGVELVKAQRPEA
jgi:hypothetical protein